MSANTLGLILVVSFVFLFSGIGFVLILLYQRKKKKATVSMSWPETKGTVIKSEVSVGESVFGSDDEGQSQPMYSALVSYTYQVENTLYTSDRISFGGKSSYSKPDKVKMVLGHYPEGKSVSVFYDPKKPEEAVLARSAEGSGVILVAGISFLVIGLLTLVIGVILLF